MKRPVWVYHAMALVTCIIWGTTFVSTKILLNHGLDPAQIMFYRFLLAYIAIWFFTRGKYFASSLKDEFTMMGAGIFGGSLYFMTENTALQITLVSNVSIIISIAPILTAIVFAILYKDQRLNRRLIFGSLVALLGVAFVVLNGQFILNISPLGDILTFIAALLWAFYNVTMRKLSSRYAILFVTRKVFFYGLLTLSPIFFFRPLNPDLTTLLQPVVLYNLLFLGLIASLICFLMWNLAVKHIGGVRTSNYIYVTPLVTLITTAIVMDEKITLIAIMGAMMILYGVYLAEKRR